MPTITTSEGTVFWTAAHVAQEAAIHRPYDRDQGQPGVVAPGATWLFATAYTTVANRGGVMRFSPSSNMLITTLGYSLLTAAAVDDPVDVGIYNSALTTKLGSSGATLGKLNGAAGTKSVTLATPVALDAGGVYYAAISVGTVGGTAATITGVGAGTINAIGPFGFTAALGLEFDTKNAVHPLPASWGALGFAGSTCPLVTVRDA